MKKIIVICCVGVMALLSGCGGGSENGSNDSTTGGSTYTSALFGTFNNCTLNIEENNLYGAKAIECSTNTLDSGWEVEYVAVDNDDNFTAPLSFTATPLESVEINSFSGDYSITVGETHSLSLSVYGKNTQTGEQRVMQTTLNVNGVSDGSNTVVTTNTYPVLVLRINLIDVNASKSATELNNIAFGFGLNQTNHAMLRNSASTRTFTPVVESEGIANDGVITVSIDEASFIDTDYKNIASINRYIKKAVIQADPFVDFSSYDANNDGILTEQELSIVVSFPQNSFSATGWYAGVSVSMLSSYSYTSDDGIKVLYKQDTSSTNTVSCLPETNFYTGIFFHEQGHTVWGLQDLYDVDYSSAGTGSIALTDRGADTFNKFDVATPSIMIAYSQVRAGFITSTEISTTQRVTLTPATLTSGHNIIKLVSNRTTEFFYLENYLFSDIRAKPDPLTILAPDADGIGGLLVTKVNTATGAYTNSNENNPIVAVIASVYDASGGIYRNFFNENDSITNIKYSDNNSSGISLSNITFNGDGSISVDITFQ